MSRTTITKAVVELNGRKKLAGAARGQIREAGGGRKKVEESDPGLHAQLAKILEETSAGDPMSALRWTNKSTEAMAEELTRQGHPVSDKTVARCLRKMGYSMQLNQKTREGPQHQNRDEQFRYLNRQEATFRKSGDPVLSVDAKKKENVDPSKTGGGRGGRRESRTESTCMISRLWRRARRYPTGHTRLETTGRWSTSG